MSRRILLVEDDPEFRSIMATTLQDAGHSVTSATNCAEAEQFWNDAPSPFDLLISDVRLEDEDDGFMLARRLLETQPTVPVLFVSGDPDCFASPAIQRFADAPFIRKPFNLEKFESTVERLLAGSAGQ